MRVAAPLVSLMLLTACGSDVPAPSPGGAAAAAETAFYEGTGTIVEILDDHVRIEHDAIPDFMGAMTMSFRAADPSLVGSLQPGMDVSFRVAVSGRSVVIDRIGPGERPGRP